MHVTRVVLAPDSFKGSLPAADVARALAAGWTDVDPGAEIDLRPMADGGEGTLDAFAAAVPGSLRMPVTVAGPDDRSVAAQWLLLAPTADAPEGTAVVELAATSGIERLEVLRPWEAHTLGFGQAIAAALEHGVSRLVLGIGSSASTDGGHGLLHALGARVTDAAGRPIPHGARGLADAHAVDLSGLRPLPPGGAVVLGDVTNPLLGARGAARVFGPQKGFAADDLDEVDRALEHWAALLPADPAAPGSGAAGGAGFALAAWGAVLVPGATEVARLIGLAESLGPAGQVCHAGSSGRPPVVITGEGGYDSQSAHGKAPSEVARIAAAAGAPVALVAGRIAPDSDLRGFAASVSLTELAGNAESALADPVRWLRVAGATIARALRERERHGRSS